MAIIQKQVNKVKRLLEQRLSIPTYQRPYKWQAHHVNQLLDDLICHKNKSSYRLGTVVLYQEPNDQQGLKPMEIVDGQQRLLTLTLIIYMLAKYLDNQGLCRSTLLETNFNSTTSINNLYHNAAIVESRLRQLSKADQTELADFLLHKCELIQVVLNDLSEAFQFFDSQNARGKALAPHDLLKAFHLREMFSNTERERTACVEHWENSINPENHHIPALHSMMGDVLFRIRRWVDGESAKRFSRHYIGVFKGISLDNDHYSYANSLRAIDYQVDQYNADSVRRWDHQQMIYPFQLDQTLLNGKRFFEYIRYYTELYQVLFLKNREELKNILATLNSYEGRHRTGDKYVRNLFESVLLFYYDRFGTTELQKASQKCFLWSYSIRLTLNRVAIESVDNEARKQTGLFRVIKRALHPHEVLAYPVFPVHENAIKGTKTDKLRDEFRRMGGLRS